MPARVAGGRVRHQAPAYGPVRSVPVTLATLATLCGRLPGPARLGILYRRPARTPGKPIVRVGTLRDRVAALRPERCHPGCMSLLLPGPAAPDGSTPAMRAAALIRVRMQACGLGMPGPKAAWLDQAGWTVARYAEVGRILDRAAAVHGADVEPRWVSFVEAAEETGVHRMTWAEGVPWLEVLAVEPVQYLSQTLVRRSNEREVFGYVGMVEDLRFAWTGI